MPPASQQTDPRREWLRQQAINRRQAVLDRIVAARMIAVGIVVSVSCILAGYMDANAHPRSSNRATAANGSSFGGAFGSNDSGGLPGTFGGGSPPSASSGAGSVVSGGS